MGPSVIPPHVEQVHKPRLLIFVDTSGSMLTRDCADMGRLEFAQRQWLKRDNLEALSEVYDLSYFGFDSEVRPLSVTALEQPASSLATGRVSRIAHCLETALGKLGPESSDAAMLVLSDGHDTESTPMQPVALLARARGIPIHTVSLGGPTLQSDLLLVAIANQQYLLAGEQGHIIAKVHQVGLGDARVSLHLRCNDQHRSQTIAFDGRQSVTVKLPVKQEKPGLYEYKISVDTVKGETEEGNNAQSVFLEVTDRRIKVLLLEGEPFWDTKFIAQTLRKDARIELTQISQLSSRKQEKIVTRSDRAGAQIPLDAEEIAKFDVIILGRGLEHFLDRRTAKLLPDFVSERGGSIVFARGRAYDPDTASGRQMGRDIAVLEPVVWGVGLSHNLSLQLTPAGLSSPCFAFGAMGDDIRRTVADLPGFTVMPVIEREKAATVVLAR
ncbi:MAG: hypothetical protein QGD94_12185, partial [Planctomycetia bacterium]|nr:hypothetical protein [Planctomycetia bacterium]